MQALPGAASPESESESRSLPADLAAVEARLSEQVGAFAASLDAKQKYRALYAFEDSERFDLRLAPLGLEGLRIDAMTEDQWSVLHGALGQVLSPEGLAKADTIRSLEVEVAETETGFLGWVTKRIRLPKRYFLSIYGEPGSQAPWGMRFDGHHLSLNWTAISGQAISPTPLFFGGQPREVPSGLARAGLRVLAEEEDLAVELIASLSDAEKERAKVPFVKGSQISRPGFVGADPELQLTPPAGLPVSALSDAQHAIFDRLLSTHLSNFVPPIAAQYRKQIAEERETLRFAYAYDVAATAAAETGDPKAGDPLYYRIQSAGFLIEFDDTPKEANHVHVVIRSALSDFGRDALKEHYAAEH